MYHLKGKRNIRVIEVPLTYKSLNSGDVFILVESEKCIFQFNGSQSSRRERAKGLELFTKLKEELKTTPEIIVFDEMNVTDAFWEALGDKGPILDASYGGSDDAVEVADKEALKLFRISDASGTLELKFESGYPLYRSMLDTNDAFLLDAGNEIFIWLGHKANKNEKKIGY